jgi:hypothetical protein
MLRSGMVGDNRGNRTPHERERRTGLSSGRDREAANDALRGFLGRLYSSGAIATGA